MKSTTWPGLYGREAVSQIITFGTMAAKRLSATLAEVLGHPYGFVDRISKLIPPEAWHDTGESL